MKKLITKLVAVAAVVTAGFLVTQVGTASAGVCSARGGMIFAQSSGEGDMNVVQVWCADGTSWYLN